MLSSFILLYNHYHHPSPDLFSSPILPVLHSHFLFPWVAWTFWGWLRNRENLKILCNDSFPFSVFSCNSLFSFWVVPHNSLSHNIFCPFVSFSLITSCLIPWFRSSAKNWTHVITIPGLRDTTMREFLCLVNYKNNLESFKWHRDLGVTWDLTYWFGISGCETQEYVFWEFDECGRQNFKTTPDDLGLCIIPSPVNMLRYHSPMIILCGKRGFADFAQLTLSESKERLSKGAWTNHTSSPFLPSFLPPFLPFKASKIFLLWKVQEAIYKPQITRIKENT